MPGLRISKKAVGLMTPQFIVLYVLAAVVTLVFYLVLQGYAAQSTPQLVIENEVEVEQAYLADALISLPNWNSEQLCLAKSEMVDGKETIYPGLVQVSRLNDMQGKGRSPAGGGTRMCASMYRPYSLDSDAIIVIDRRDNLDWGAIVTDLENSNSWHLNTAETTAEGKNTVERTIAIEYPGSIVHAGKLQLWICEGECT